MLGPGAILAAMAIGAGELILWPVLVTKQGFGLLWLIPLALAIQYFWLVESARWTIATGESWIQASGRIPGRGLWVGLWLAVMTISLIWPGWAVASAVALWAFTGGAASPLSLRMWGVVAYIISVAALVLPGTVYRGLFIASAVSLIIFNIGLAASTIVVAAHNPHSVVEALKGMVSFGHVPPGVDMKLLASAVA